MNATLVGGIDEANKGQVLGPIFVALAYTKTDALTIPLISDSKKITLKALSRLDEFLKRYHIEFLIEEIAVQDLQQVNINTVIRDRMSKLINTINLSHVVVDSHYKDPLKLKQELTQLTTNRTNLLVAHRADENHPLVAVASLVAYRRKLQYFSDATKLYGQIGSGNLTDKLTIAYIRSNYPNIPILKKKWSLRSIFKDHD